MSRRVLSGLGQCSDTPSVPVADRGSVVSRLDAPPAIACMCCKHTRSPWGPPPASSVPRAVSETTSVQASSASVNSVLTAGGTNIPTWIRAATLCIRPLSPLAPGTSLNQLGNEFGFSQYCLRTGCLLSMAPNLSSSGVKGSEAQLRAGVRQRRSPGWPRRWRADRPVAGSVPAPATADC